MFISSISRRGLFPPILLAMAAPVHAASNEMQFWLSQGATIRLNPDTSVGVDASERFSNQSNSKNQYLARLLIQQRVAKGVQLGGGFAWSETGGINEYRPFQEVTLSKGLIALRSRIEERFYDDTNDIALRFRERIQFTIPFEHTHSWNGVANAETFFNLNHTDHTSQTGLGQIRTLIGLRRIINNRYSVTFSFQRQQTIVRGGQDSIVHQPIIQLTAVF